MQKYWQKKNNERWHWNVSTNIFCIVLHFLHSVNFTFRLNILSVFLCIRNDFDALKKYPIQNTKSGSLTMDGSDRETWF